MKTTKEQDAYYSRFPKEAVDAALKARDKSSEPALPAKEIKKAAKAAKKAAKKG